MSDGTSTYNQKVMRFTTALLAGLVTADTIASAPVVEQDAGLLPTHELSPFGENATTLKQRFHKKSRNWVGAILIGSDFQTVTGTFIVPEIVPPADAHIHKEYAASAWVGLDGKSSGCKGVIMQTGLHMRTRNGKLRYEAWYQWYPNNNVRFTDMEITPGDSMTLTLSTSSTSGGIAIVENNTKKASVNHTWVDQTPHLCRTGAEWIVEDFSTIHFGQKARVPFADFGSVTFTNASAADGNGTRFGPADARLEDIFAGKQSDEFLLTNVTVDNSSVYVIYDKRRE
ncbi:hypothetical protein E4T44_02177 [Aureobasidium sp. EXF-8845]|nr:hypothetical protein E4T44_02177 [Aureobasidium sp. EXF-8845]KAI4856383.1 hypothetical protein E4T45_02155 [Aureobasidium sp. EXF-8846]